MPNKKLYNGNNTQQQYIAVKKEKKIKVKSGENGKQKIKQTLN